MFSRMPGKVSRCDVDFVKCKQKVFPLSVCVHMRKILSRSPTSRLSASQVSVPGKTFVSYERKATFHVVSYQGEISLVNLSKCFLGNLPI